MLLVDEDVRGDFNGVDATSGAYLFEPMSAAELAELATGRTLERDQPERDQAHLAELRSRHADKDATHYGVKEGIDPTKLEQAGWGAIFAAHPEGSDEAREQDAIREALSPLLALRKLQATKNDERYYKEYRGPLGYNLGETKQRYLARLGAGPGPADPSKVPYYLLIVGSPEHIPFAVQYQIDVQYAVGRLHFETITEYNNYARSVVEAETGGVSRSRELAFVGVANPNDRATALSRTHLVGPLADEAEGWREDIPGWTISRYFDDDANKAKVSQLFGGAQTPALLFSASHGVGFRKTDPRQQRHQGALLLQDWPGPNEWRGPLDESLYFSGDDLRSDAGLLGMIAFNFACYGSGTPQYDDFSSRRVAGQRKQIAERGFVADLPRKLLSHPKGGALATIGHVDRAWGCSFAWGADASGAPASQLAVFESALAALMKGAPVGVALEYFNARYAELASDLSSQIDALDFNPDAVSPATLAGMWTSSNDARSYAIMGDPAVRLSFDDVDGGGASRERASIDVPNFVPDSAPGEARAIVDGDEASQQHEDFATKVMHALGEAIDASKILEVRTYTSDDLEAVAAAPSGEPNPARKLRMFTRIGLGGDVEVTIPEREGVVDTGLSELHIEMVKQAQAARAELLAAVFEALSKVRED